MDVDLYKGIVFPDKFSIGIDFSGSENESKLIDSLSADHAILEKQVSIRTPKLGWIILRRETA